MQQTPEALAIMRAIENERIQKLIDRSLKARQNVEQ